MPTYKYYYFDAKARGEIVRLIFNVAGVPFEDVRIKGEDWPKHIADSPTGQLPYLEIDGKVKIPQSLAIARHIARINGLGAKTDVDRCRGDVIVDMYRDIFEDSVPFLFEKDENKKKEILEKITTKLFPRLKFVNEVYCQNKNGDGWFFGDALTWVDLYAMAMGELFKFIDADVLKPYPKLAAHYERVRAHPKVAAYLKTRTESQF